MRTLNELRFEVRTLFWATSAGKKKIKDLKRVSAGVECTSRIQKVDGSRESCVCISVCFSGCSAFQRSDLLIFDCNVLMSTVANLITVIFFVFTQRARMWRSISGISCANDSFTCVVFVVRKNSLSFLCRTHDYEREKDFPVRTARARSLSLCIQRSNCVN